MLGLLQIEVPPGRGLRNPTVHGGNPAPPHIAYTSGIGDLKWCKVSSIHRTDDAQNPA